MNILVERYKGLGDVLFSLIICKGLFQKYSFPVSFATRENYFPLFHKCKFIKEGLKKEEIDRRKFKLRFNLQDQIDFLPICAQDHRLNLLAEICGLDTRFLDFDFKLSVSTYQKRKARRKLTEKGIKEQDFLIGIHLRSIAEIRTWLIQYNLQLAQMLVEQGKKIIILENQIDKEFFLDKEHIFVPEDMDLSDLVGYISQCDLVICPDSGIMHLAGFLDIPFVALFGPILPDFRVRYYRKKRIHFKKDLECILCWDWQKGTCWKKNYKQCMTSIRPDEVLDSINDLIEELHILGELK